MHTNRTAIAASWMVFALAVLGGIFGAGSAHASGRCLFQGDWNCYGSPQWNGPQLPTWEVPGPINQPVTCDPYGYHCSAFVTP